MQFRPVALLLFVAACLFGTAAVAVAQEPPPAPAAGESLDARIDKAIADYEAVRGDRDKLAQRKKLLGWLGELDHPRVTQYLKKELAAVAKSPLAATVLEAIGKVARPDLEPDMLAVLRQPKAQHAVRVAAAAAIVGLGDRASDRMLDLALAEGDGAPEPALRNAVVDALVASGSSRVQRGLAPLLQRGDEPERVAMLRRTAAIHGVAPISNARIVSIREGTLLVAAIAWHQLMEEEHPRGKELTVDMLERVLDVPSPPVAAELVAGLVRVRDADFYPALLRYGAISGKEVKQALRDAAAEAAKDRNLLDWLVVNGLDAELPQQRAAAKVLLMRAPAEVVAPLVERLRKDLKRHKKTALEAAAGLHDLLAKDPSWAQDLATLAAGRDLQSRLLGLSMLGEMESPVGVPLAQKYLDAKAWELRSLCYRYLTKCRDVSSIPFLIDRYGKEEGRLAHELDQALFVHTGSRCWTKKDWQQWWKEHATGFVLPHPDSVKGGGGSGGGRTIAYYDIPLVSARVAFLVDHSGSMKAPVSTDDKRTRLDAAKEQLKLVVEALPDTHMVNLIPFETNVTSLWKELRRLDRESRQEFLEKSQLIPFGQGTNTFGALERAFEDETVDTIYLLTDGVPTVGAVTDIDDILDAIQRINRTRQVVIHCISIGLDSDLLRELAAMTGGEYRFVR